MKLTEFDYELPKDRIAQYPGSGRDRCKLMVLDRMSGTVEHKVFCDITGYFKKGDVLILNDTRVLNARLFAKRMTGGRVELFIINQGDPCEALIRPAARLKDGEELTLESGDKAWVLSRAKIGRYVRFNRSISDIMKESGHVPLPPYIDRNDGESDSLDYQTVYARKDGATASPTAGLHFTGELLQKIGALGVNIGYVTLHTNYGTFAPVKTDDVRSHVMHEERFDLPQEAADMVNNAKERGNKVFTVGTTSTRVLEHCARICRGSSLKAESGSTALYIYPGYKFGIVDHIITNFHLPKSTLMILVSAFAGKDLIMKAYREAIASGYRFFSYGDAMLIL